MKTSFRRVRNFALGTALGTACLAFAGSAFAEDIIVGLITKTDINPFFVKMKEGAEAKAKELGVELRSYAGKVDGDNESQVAAIESLIAAGAKGILITPSDTKAIVHVGREGARGRHPGDRARHAARAHHRRRRHAWRPTISRPAS